MSRRPMLLSSIISHITDQYGSLESPSYAFVQETMARNPYSELVVCLAELSDQVAEDTDPNDDVSFGYGLDAGAERLFLQLSMVGPFAVVQRVLEAGYNELIDSESPCSDFEKSILRLLEGAEIVVLEDELLKSMIPLRLPNAESDRATIYQALFTDSETVPWT